MKTSSILLASLLLGVACSGSPSYRGQPATRTVADDSEAMAEGDEERKKSESQAGKEANSQPGADPVQPSMPGPAKVRSSQGVGGGTGLLEVPFTDSTGLASTYKINAPADAGQKVYGLHIHLHGDGGGGYVDFPNRELRYDLIGVTVKAPNTNLQWGRVQGKQHALYVNELIQKELTRKYDINLDKVYFSGVSGGAYFMMGSFLPEFGHLYNSAAFIMCGGEPPRVAFTEPAMLGKFRIHVEVTAGERQDILTSVQSTVSAYKNAAAAAGIAADQQAKLQTVTIAGAGGHCVFDGASYTTGIQLAIDTKFKMVLPP